MFLVLCCFLFFFFFFFFKQKTAYEIMPSLVGSEMCIRDRFSQCHFIEFMACPGGCLGGGGQPIPTNVDIRTARAKAIYAEDAHYGETGRARKSHENPAVLRLYGEFLTDGPCGHTSHHLLHTEYTARGTFVDASARSTEESTC